MFSCSKFYQQCHAEIDVILIIGHVTEQLSMISRVFFQSVLLISELAHYVRVSRMDDSDATL